MDVKPITIKASATMKKGTITCPLNLNLRRMRVGIAEALLALSIFSI